MRKKRNINLDTILNKAKSLDHLLLSNKYEGTKSRIELKCKNGHVWTSRVENFLSHGNCPYCSGIRINNEKILDFIKEKGYIPHKEFVYIDCKTKMKLLCKKHGEFSINRNNLISGHGCYKCGIKKNSKNVSFSYQEVKKEFSDKGWTLLSKRYNGIFKNLKAICPKGHITNKSFKSLKDGNGCNECKENKNELECKKIIEKLTGKIFCKVRPDFLKNELTGRNLELDCFNEELKIGLEYNGEQHYQKNEAWGGQQSLDRYIKRDKLKVDLCKKANILLIVVPYKIKDKESFIKEQLSIHEEKWQNK